jgi:hypothetical protein
MKNRSYPGIHGVGWDRWQPLRLGYACWMVAYEGFGSVIFKYRNLQMEKTWELGAMVPGTSVLEILSWIAAQTDVTPSDWITINDRIYSFTFDRGWT